MKNQKFSLHISIVSTSYTNVLNKINILTFFKGMIKTYRKNQRLKKRQPCRHLRKITILNSNFQFSTLVNILCYTSKR